MTPRMTAGIAAVVALLGGLAFVATRDSSETPKVLASLTSTPTVTPTPTPAATGDPRWRRGTLIGNEWQVPYDLTTCRQWRGDLRDTQKSWIALDIIGVLRGEWRAQGPSSDPLFIHADRLQQDISLACGVGSVSSDAQIITEVAIAFYNTPGAEYRK